MATQRKETIMRAHVHTTVWGTHVNVGRTKEGLGPLRHLREWLTSHRTQRKGTATVRLNGDWDAQREQFQPLTAESATELAVKRGGFAVAMELYGNVI